MLRCTVTGGLGSMSPSSHTRLYHWKYCVRPPFFQRCGTCFLNGHVGEGCVNSLYCFLSSQITSVTVAREHKPLSPPLGGTLIAVGVARGSPRSLPQCAGALVHILQSLPCALWCASENHLRAQGDNCLAPGRMLQTPEITNAPNFAWTHSSPARLF